MAYQPSQSAIETATATRGNLPLDDAIIAGWRSISSERNFSEPFIFLADECTSSFTFRHQNTFRGKLRIIGMVRHSPD